MIYTKDNIVGVKFTANSETEYKISGIDGNGSCIVTFKDDDGQMKQTTYTLNASIHYLNEGNWKPIKEPTTPRQQAGDLLSEFVEHYNRHTDTSPLFPKDIQDFLTHKFGE